MRALHFVRPPFLPGLLLVCLVALGGGSAMAAPPTTWAELQSQMKGTKDGGRRASMLLRFAKDDHPALAERLKAVRAARQALAGNDARKVEAWIVEAELQAVGGSAKKRRDALANARGAAARLKQTEKVARLDEARAGEEAMVALATLVKKREQQAPPSPPAAPAPVPAAAAAPDELSALAQKVEGALPAWLALGDERQHGAARVLLGRRQAVAGDNAGAVRVLSDVVDALGDGRDAAGVRADAWRLLATLFEAQSMWPDAAAAALAADRAAAADPKKVLLPTTALPTVYVRHRETAALCKRARAQNVLCAKVEKDRWGDRTFYDFSVEPRGAFEPARADDVLAEYDSVLQDCLKQGARANLTTNTHVELEWPVGNDGRVLKSFDLRPMRLRGTLVETCLAQAFSLFRYPPYKGEMQHVRVAIDVGEVQGPTVR